MAAIPVAVFMIFWSDTVGLSTSNPRSTSVCDDVARPGWAGDHLVEMELQLRPDRNQSDPRLTCGVSVLASAV